jgi:hypothetical protein
MAERDGHKKQPLFERAAVRFCLSAPEKTPGVKEFLEKRKKENPERVKEIADLLELEEKAAAAAVSK